MSRPAKRGNLVELGREVVRSASQVKMVVSDLDGTLFQSNSLISARNLATLHQLKKQNVVRVVATGRSLHAAKVALPDDFPIDYLVFSCGAGVVDWKTKSILSTKLLRQSDVRHLLAYFENHEVDFMLHDPIPENHRFAFRKQSKIGNPDFQQRCEKNASFCRPLEPAQWQPTEATQFLVILPPAHRGANYEYFREQLVAYNVIRTTSPLDAHSVWVEVFPRGVSKGAAGDWLCQQLGFGSHEVMAIGNDYNDADLLSWAGSSFIVANSPYELTVGRQIVGHDLENGFSEAVDHWLNVGR